MGQVKSKYKKWFQKCTEVNMSVNTYSYES